MIHPSYRNELKYLVSPPERILLSRQLERIFPRDPHADGKGYTIKSLYFDSPDNDALMDNLMGIGQREKFRLRCYNDDILTLRLEKKVKQLDHGFKVSVPLTRDEVIHLLQGDIEFLKNSGQALLREFYCRSRGSGLQPVLVVTYFREPFLFAPGNVRITLDEALRFSHNAAAFLDPAIPMIREASGKCLVEVKFDEFLPDLVQGILSSHGLVRTAHSKYVTGRFLTGT